MRPAYRPELTMAIMIPFFQQVTGVPSTRSCGPLTPMCSWRRIAKDTFHHHLAQARSMSVVMLSAPVLKHLRTAKLKG